MRLAAESVAPLRPRDVADLCASFQAAIVDVVEDRIRIGLKLFRRADRRSPRAVVVAGGVAANAALREALTRFCAEAGLPLVAPPQKLCTDNGAMIAWAGIERLRLGLIDALDAPGAAALAARPEIRARAQQQSLRRRSREVSSRSARAPLLALDGSVGRPVLVLFVGEMVADDAAAERAQDRMMAGVMAGDAADQRALEAALGLGGNGRDADAKVRARAMTANDANFIIQFRCCRRRTRESGR